MFTKVKEKFEKTTNNENDDMPKKCLSRERTVS